MPIIKLKIFKKKISIENLKKSKGVPPLVFFQVFDPIFCTIFHDFFDDWIWFKDTKKTLEPMSIAHLFDFKRNRTGESSQPGGWRGRSNFQCSSARGQASNQRSWGSSIRAKINKILMNEAKKNRLFKIVMKIYGMWQIVTKIIETKSDKSDSLVALRAPWNRGNPFIYNTHFSYEHLFSIVFSIGIMKLAQLVTLQIPVPISQRLQDAMQVYHSTPVFMVAVRLWLQAAVKETLRLGTQSCRSACYGAKRKFHGQTLEGATCKQQTTSDKHCVLAEIDGNGVIPPSKRRERTNDQE